MVDTFKEGATELEMLQKSPLTKEKTTLAWKMDFQSFHSDESVVTGDEPCLKIQTRLRLLGFASDFNRMLTRYFQRCILINWHAPSTAYFFFKRKFVFIFFRECIPSPKKMPSLLSKQHRFRKNAIALELTF